MCFLRSVFASLIAWLVANKDIPDVMWNSVPSNGFYMILLRSSVNIIVLNALYHVSKVFKMSTVLCFKAISPLITLVLGYFLLREAIERSDIAQLIFGLSAVILIALGM